MSTINQKKLCFSPMLALLSDVGPLCGRYEIGKHKTNVKPFIFAASLKGKLIEKKKMQLKLKKGRLSKIWFQTVRPKNLPQLIPL